MLVSECLDSVYRAFGDETAIKMFKDAGFEAFDYSLFDMFEPYHPLNQPDAKEYLERLIQIKNDCNIVCNQCHAPFPSSVGNDKDDPYIYEHIISAMEAASKMGAKIIVVHPKQHLVYWENVELLKQMNIEFYKSLIPYCEKYNIKVAVENMYQCRDGRVVDSTCANPYEFREYLDLIDSPWIVACMDVGHVAITHYEYDEYVRVLGDKLQAIHLHDNDCINDNHAIPLTQNIDMNAVMAALKKYGYKGDLTCEVQFNLEKEKHFDTLVQIRENAEKLRKLIKE